MRLPAIVVLLLVPAVALAGQVRDEVRVYADGSPEEVWVYEGSIDPANLREKLFYWPDGADRRREFWRGEQQSGPFRGWHENGSLQSEGRYEAGLENGVFVTYDSVAEGEKPIVATEETWVAGKLHGRLKVFDGWGENRYARIERSFDHGVLHGPAIVRRAADRMVRKYSFDAGLLHGRQFAWHGDGRMRFQYEFKHGEPHGAQRRWESGDEPIEELHFVDGEPHGTLRWEWFSGDQRQAVQEWSSGLITHTDGDRITRYRLERSTPLREEADYSHPLEQDIRLLGELREVDSYSFEDGRLTRIRITLQDGVFTQLFHPGGGLAALGHGDESRRSGLWLTFWADGSPHVESYHEGHKRMGTWTVRDRAGRVREIQEWDYYRSRWLVMDYTADGTKLHEGDIVADPGASPHKTGTWRYWREDGTPLREETYGPGPYSGNRPHIEQMTQWLPDGRPEFEGSEKELRVFTYSEDDEEVVVRTRVVELLDRSRFGHEYYDEDTMKIVLRESKEQPVEVAQELHLSIGRAVVVGDQRHRGDGSPKRLDTFDKEGRRHGTFQGWYRDGTVAYTFTYRRGLLQAAEEWWKDGSPRAVLTFRRAKGDDDAEFPRLSEGRWISREGRAIDYRLGDRDAGFRDPDGVLDRCAVWKFDARAERPE